MNAFRRRLLALTAAAPLWAVGRAYGSNVPRALGYVPWWMAAAWRDMPFAQLDRLILFELAAQGDGRIKDNDWPARAPEIAGHAREHRVPIEVALTVHGEGLFNQIFSDARARRVLAEQCERWTDRSFVGGLHLDVEGYAAADKGAIAAFRDWLAAIDANRKKARKGLSAFFPADDQFTPYDAASAARIDYWVAQIYDAHSVDAKRTGPVVTRARDNEVGIPRALARLERLRIPRSAILLSVPLYGWEWRAAAGSPGARTLGEGRLLTYAETPARLMPEDRKVATDLARQHGLRRDAEHTPYYSYADAGAWVQGWYEDMESLMRKLAPERGRGYGLAFFPLGYDGNTLVEPLLHWWRSAA